MVKVLGTILLAVALQSLAMTGRELAAVPYRVVAPSAQPKKRKSFEKKIKKVHKKVVKVVKKIAPIAIAVVGVAVPVVGIAGGIIMAGVKAHEKKRAEAKAKKKEEELLRQEEAAEMMEEEAPRALPYSARTTRVGEDLSPRTGAPDDTQAGAKRGFFDTFMSWFN